MTTRLTDWIVLITALGSAVVGGVLYAFSAFVMQGLDRLPPQDSIAAMQQINREAPRGPLLVPLMGTTALCLVLMVVAGLSLRSGLSLRAVLVSSGCVLYLLAFAITAGYHVPHNDALALVRATAPGAAHTWHDYARPWVLLNHVRSAAAILGAGVLALSLTTD